MKTTDYARHAPAAMLQIAPAVSPWIMVAPVISTAHIRPEDDARLQNDDIGNGPVMANLKPGYLLCIDDLTDFEGYSDGMLHLLETFHHLGFHYLRLDPDGDRLDDLPQFEW